MAVPASSVAATSAAAFVTTGAVAAFVVSAAMSPPPPVPAPNPGRMPASRSATAGAVAGDGRCAAAAPGARRGTSGSGQVHLGGAAERARCERRARLGAPDRRLEPADGEHQAAPGARREVVDVGSLDAQGEGDLRRREAEPFPQQEGVTLTLGETVERLLRDAHLVPHLGGRFHAAARRLRGGRRRARRAAAGGRARAVARCTRCARSRAPRRRARSRPSRPQAHGGRRGTSPASRPRRPRATRAGAMRSGRPSSHGGDRASRSRARGLAATRKPAPIPESVGIEAGAEVGIRRATISL